MIARILCCFLGHRWAPFYGPNECRVQCLRCHSGVDLLAEARRNP